jgi:prepilin-type N-terminal cleavage/methylation domain-containing protein
VKSVVPSILKHVRYRNGFTLVEVTAAMLLLGLLIASSLTLTNRYIDTVIDMQMRGQAFEIARSNMERLLSENTLPEMNEYGIHEFYPELDWETMVEPFYEPVTNRMWIRAVCSAGFTDTKGERQDVELEHWIANLTPDQIRMIRAQQKAEEEYMKLLQGGELTDTQKATVAFMLQEGLDVEAYRKFIKSQLRRKMEYLSKNSMYDNAYVRFSQQLEAEENAWLENHGFDFDRYNEFAKDFDPADYELGAYSGYDGSSRPNTSDPSNPSNASNDPGSSDPSGGNSEAPDTNPNDNNNDIFDWSNIPPELVPILEQLLGIKKP